jgi:hypothetical protein
MGIELDVYYVYRVKTRNHGEHYLCFTAHRRGYNNAKQQDADMAETQLDEHKEKRLQEALNLFALSDHVLSAEMIGCSYTLPVGEELFDTSTVRMLDIWIAETEYRSPWVVLGTADTEDEFWREVNSDSELQGLKPKSPAKRLTVSFYG